MNPETLRELMDAAEAVLDHFQEEPLPWPEAVERLRVALEETKRMTP